MRKFVVLKDIGKALSARDIVHTGKEVDVAVMLEHLSEYFAEVRTGKFNDGWEYTGEFRAPAKGEYYLHTAPHGIGEYIRLSPYNQQYYYRHYILRPALKPIPAGAPFNDDYEYTGEIRLPHAGDTFVQGTSETLDANFGALEFKFGMDVPFPRYILRKIKKAPTKEETIKALEASITHWLEDILPLAVSGDGHKMLLGSENCPLCKLFVSNNCSDCPLGGCKGGRISSAYEKFIHNRTPENALNMITYMQARLDNFEYEADFRKGGQSEDD